MLTNKNNMLTNKNNMLTNKNNMLTNKNNMLKIQTHYAHHVWSTFLIKIRTLDIKNIVAEELKKQFVRYV